MSKTLAVMATSVAGLLLAGQSAQASFWTGAGDGVSYEDTNNWNDMLAFPGGTRDINGAFTVTRAVDTTAQRTFIKGGAVLNVTAGAHNDNRSGASIFNFLGDSSAGTVNQSGGLYEIGHGLRIGVGNGNGDGTYNLTGGDLIIYRGSNSKMEPLNPGGRPSMEVGDNNGAPGLFEISGTASFATRAGVHVAGAGTFSVIGSAVAGIGIGSNQSGDGGWIQHAGGTIKARIDGGGVTPIFVDDVDATLGVVAEFGSGSLLDLGFTGAEQYGTWTLMEVENTDIVDGGLGTAGSVHGGWSFNIDNSGDNGLLTVTYVPEPSTAALVLGAFGGLLALRRKLR